jgi:hypothetical protein
MTGLMRPSASSGHARLQLGGDARLELDRTRTQRRARHRQRRRRISPRLISAFAPPSSAISTIRPPSERGEFARQVRRADHVEDHVDAAVVRQRLDDLDEILGLVVDRTLGAERLACPAFVRRAGRREHAETERMRDLDGRHADPARAALHQQRFCSPPSPAPSSARSNTLLHTVKNVSGNDAASMSVRPPGTGRHCGSGATAYSA